MDYVRFEDDVCSIVGGYRSIGVQPRGGGGAFAK